MTKARMMASWLKLHRWKDVISHLHDAFRDHHLQKYDELTDFKHVAHRIWLLARCKVIYPQLPESHVLGWTSGEGRDLGGNY
jgi:hypothetical protein